MPRESDFHEAVFQASGIDFYGRNLDALHDLITGLVEPPIEIRWINAAASREAFGVRFDAIVEVLRDAEAEFAPGEYRLVVEMGC